jgi:uncharacterized protein (DUF488 family)
MGSNMVKKRNKKEWPLFTIGYENYSLDEFGSFLKSQGIKNLVDVRQYPKSRKAGFSKSQLEKYFAADGIKYTHIGRLGSPAEIRKLARDDKNYSLFFRKYQSYMVTQEESLSQLAEIIQQDTTCIFCLEDDYGNCHRKTLAAYMNILYSDIFNIIHL